MATNKLIPYWIEVREADEPNSTWDQTSLQTHEPEFPFDNLADYFENFLKEYKDEGDVYKDRDEKKTFTVAPPIKRKGNTIEGRLKSGEWGRNADFFDVDKHTRIEDARKENYAEEIPYYFLFHVPEQDPTQGLLLLSKYKRKGIKTLFEKLFRPRKQGEDIGDGLIEINPHYSDQVEEKLEEVDGIASINFRGKDKIPAREKYADTQNIQRVHDEISGQLDIGVEMKVTPRNNERSFRQLAKELLPSKDTQNFEYGKIEEYDFDTANVTVVEGESQLTFSLWEERIQMRLDIDPKEHDLVTYGGYPTPHSIGRVARGLANDLLPNRCEDLDPKSLMPKDAGVSEEDADQIPAQD